MRSSSKKRVVGGDRLSELPDQLIVHILSFLSTQDAVRTMLLRRFGDLWTLVPNLSFCCCPVNYDSTHQCSPNFHRFIRNVLILHQSLSIDKFQVCLSRVKYHRASDDISLWLKFGSCRQVKEFEFDGYAHTYILPALTCQSLVKLHLSCCEIKSGHQVRLVSLKKLLLEFVQVDDDAFQELIFGCPSLQELEVADPIGLDELRFTSPNIEKFRLSLRELDGRLLLDCPNLKFLDLVIPHRVLDVADVSSLTAFNIQTDESPESCCDDLSVFLKKFKDVEVFRLSYKAFMVEEAKFLDFPQNRWKRVVLKFQNCDEDRLVGIYKLLRSSIHLEEITIDVRKFSRKASGFCMDLLSSQCELPQLKIVTMFGFYKLCEARLQLVEFLLKSAVVLEKLIIVPQVPDIDDSYSHEENQLTHVKEIEFFKKVTSFQRASANARVVFA